MSWSFTLTRIQIVCNSRVFSRPIGLMVFECWVVICNRQHCTRLKNRKWWEVCARTTATGNALFMQAVFPFKPIKLM